MAYEVPVAWHELLHNSCVDVKVFLHQSINVMNYVIATNAWFIQNINIQYTGLNGFINNNLNKCINKH